MIKFCFFRACSLRLLGLSRPAILRERKNNESGSFLMCFGYPRTYNSPPHPTFVLGEENLAGPRTPKNFKEKNKNEGRRLRFRVYMKNKIRQK